MTEHAEAETWRVSGRWSKGLEARENTEHLGSAEGSNNLGHARHPWLRLRT